MTNVELLEMIESLKKISKRFDDLTAENEKLKAENAELLGNRQFIISKAVDYRLEIARLKEALGFILAATEKSFRDRTISNSFVMYVRLKAKPALAKHSENIDDPKYQEKAEAALQDSMREDYGDDADFLPDNMGAK